jgi:hypothetical protein
MFDMVIICKFCGKKDIHGWHPIWKDRKICIPCQDKMYVRHKVWMDKLLRRSRVNSREVR